MSFDDSASVVLTFYPAGAGMMPMTTSIWLDPRLSMFFDETRSELFPDATGIGALRVSSGTDVAATARIFNDQREAERRPVHASPERRLRSLDELMSYRKDELDASPSSSYFSPRQ